MQPPSAPTRRHKPLFYDLIMAQDPWEVALLERSAGLTQRGSVPNLLIERGKPVIVTDGERRPTDQSPWGRKNDGSGSDSMSTLSE